MIGRSCSLLSLNWRIRSMFFAYKGKLSLASNKELFGTVPSEIGRLSNLGESITIVPGLQRFVEAFACAVDSTQPVHFLSTI